MPRIARIEFWNLLACDLTAKGVSKKLLEHEFLQLLSTISPPNEYVVAQEAT